MTLMVACFLAAPAEIGRRATARTRTARTVFMSDNVAMDDDLRNELLLLRDFGFTHLELTVGRWPLAEDSSSSANSQPSTDNLLGDLERLALVCEKCRLSRTRTQVVYGVGNPKAD